MGLIQHKRVGLYVHIPFCVKKCPYCAFYSEPVDNFDAARVVSSLISEVQSYDSIVPSTIYIGGGSPSCLPYYGLMRLVEKLSGLNPDQVEFTVEVNPSQVTIELLNVLQTAGVNRLSIGAQSFNKEDLRVLGRGHTSDDIVKAVKLAREVGFDNISLDLIFAVPGTTIESWQNSLAAAIGLDVEHISAYSLTYEKDTPLFAAKDSGGITAVGEDLDRSMYETAIDILAEAGYRQYEISNFAKAGFQCDHNRTYWRNTEYIGIGPAAGSYWNGKRTMNIADIDSYVGRIETGQNVVSESQQPTQKEVVCETMVLGLRMTEGVDLAEYKIKTGFAAEDIFSQAIGLHVKNGFIEIINGKLRLTRQAYPVADVVLCDFADFAGE